MRSAALVSGAIASPRELPLCFGIGNATPALPPPALHVVAVWHLNGWQLHWQRPAVFRTLAALALAAVLWQEWHPRTPGRVQT